MARLRFSIWDSSIHLFQVSIVQFSCKTGNHGTFSLSVYTPCSGCIVSKLGWTHSYNIRSLSHMHGHTLTKFYDCVWWSCSVWPLHVWVKVVHKLEASAPNIPWNKFETSLAVVSWKKKLPLWCYSFLSYISCSFRICFSFCLYSRSTKCQPFFLQTMKSWCFSGVVPQ